MTMRFVIVDDDIGFRGTICNIIKKNQFGVVVAQCGDGLEAESVIIEFQPDIVVIDLLLPGQSGIDLIKQFNNPNNKVSFIMISSFCNKSMITQFLLNGIDYYLCKPIDILCFTSLIKKVVESKVKRQTLK